MKKQKSKETRLDNLGKAIEAMKKKQTPVTARKEIEKIHGKLPDPITQKPKQ